MDSELKNLSFYIVDVFAEKRFQGNQLAVVLTNNDLSNEQMLAIAREMNFSETAFLNPQAEAKDAFQTRIFTPQEEIPFAGHPALGTAFVIKNYLLQKKISKIKLLLPKGLLTVSCYDNYDHQNFYFEHFQPEFGQTIEHELMAEVLQLEKNDFDQNFLPQEVSTGLPFIVAPLRSLAAVRKAKPIREKIRSILKNHLTREILIFSRETYHSQNDLNLRVFLDIEGITEDPATGSASGCLGAYLLRNNYLKKTKLNLRLEQGHEIGRPSLILLKAKMKSKSYRIITGGKVIPVARGRLIFNENSQIVQNSLK